MERYVVYDGAGNVLSEGNSKHAVISGAMGADDGRLVGVAIRPDGSTYNFYVY